MAVICDRARIAYFPVPKAACTSLKTLFWEINHGRARPGRPSFGTRMRRKFGLNIVGETLQTEEGYRTEDFDPGILLPPGYERVAVVRDPLARLCSAWSSKVNRKMFERHQEVEKLEALGLNSSPSFADFVDHFDQYRVHSVPVTRHTGGFPQYLGEDLEWYTRVFPIEQLGDLETYLRQRTNADIHIPVRNKSRPELRDKSLEPRHQDKLAMILAADYRLLSNYYTFDDAIRKFL
jgi:hypothetical protein